MMNKIKVLFLGCNESQIPYLTEIKMQNYFVVGVDLNDNCKGKYLCDKFYNIGYDNFEELLSVGEKENFTFSSKVFTAGAQFAHRGAAVFAKHFNIKYPSLEKIDFCLDKVKYYDYFLKNCIPLPKTFYIINKSDLIEKINNNNEIKNFYLKSDYSKNPNYVYRLNRNTYDSVNIFWGRDRYLVNCYILQEEFVGVSVRINVYGNRFNVIDFETGVKTDKHHDLINKFKIFNVLEKIIGYLEMEFWLLKFDIIINQGGFVIIDIGIDPPSRMLSCALQNNINFYKHYCNLYLNSLSTFPKLLD
jgi:hypothetical protein